MKANWWQSLDEPATPASCGGADEFPPGAMESPPTDRRDFLKIMGASAALATLGACGRMDHEAIVPYAHDVPLVPGVPAYFATAVTIAGAAIGVIARSNEGRPTKLEGNPDHPASLGATDAFTQASLLTLYDPERSHAVRRGRGDRSEVSTWDQFVEEFNPRMDEHRAQGGRGLALLTGGISSPSTLALLQRLQARMPKARHYRHEPLEDPVQRAAFAQAAGRPADLVLDLTKADVIVSFGSDFLSQPPTGIRYARDFASRRRVREGTAPDMNRLYAVESHLSLTGANSDHRLAMAPSRIAGAARALAFELGKLGRLSGAMPDRAGDVLTDAESRWVAAAAKDLAGAGPRGLVVAGPGMAGQVQSLALALSGELGGFGTTAIFIEPAASLPQGSIEELCAAIDAGQVRTLVIIACNPIYDAPANLEFAASLAKVSSSVHMGMYRDETGHNCDWHLPLTHDLESWSDTRAFDGTASIIQPLISPLYNGRTAQELLAALLNVPIPNALELVRAYWREKTGHGAAAEFERWWRTTLRAGVIAGSRSPAIKTPSGLWSAADTIANMPSATPSAEPGSIELCFAPDPTIHDGRFSNNAWLQELPKPLTKLTWDNALLISPAQADRLGLKQGDVTALESEDRSITAPVFVQPGQADGSATVHLGYGRTRAGSVGDGRGVNAYALRTTANRWTLMVRITKTRERYLLAIAQGHSSLEGANLVREATVAEYMKDPGATTSEDRRTVHLSMYQRHKYSGTQWGMSIDTGACNGCSACLIACQAENNIPVVGKDQVVRGRAMHWVRVDRYYQGPPAAPKVLFAPIPCMHCEDAPCELVCPVGATQHSEDGLNEMVYNRCIGTRYCSNNCPYKVRRFNFYRFSDAQSEPLKLMRNPQVSVRGRGVMEKCTYCVQRIRAAEIEGREQNRPIRRGEVVTACQQACPTSAIIFGNINDGGDAVAREKAQPQSYSMLGELNTHPRTTYLSAVRNPSPDLPTGVNG